ncbi:MAG: hypothetical protein QG554_1103 [Pseudomonadota bacterium]|jgi:hypothetical protein|nr:hypothetical protein [Pseudomonadota bacterium]
MTTRPHPADPSGSTHEGTAPFAGLGAGLGFFQDWMKAAGAALPGMTAQPGAAIPGVPAWSLPTLDPEELDKRIQELKTVQFWLEQNSRMIAMTIQGMEVQKMTLSTLKGMNVSMDTLRDTLKAAVPSTPTPAAEAPAAPVATEASTKAAAPATDAEPGNDLINPMRWWDALAQQFSHLAQQAAQASPPPAPSAEPPHSPPAPARKAPARKQAASKRARKTPPAP